MKKIKQAATLLLILMTGICIGGYILANSQGVKIFAILVELAVIIMYTITIQKCNNQLKKH